MKTQVDFFQKSAQKVSILNNNNMIMKYYQLPTFMPKNTLYNKNFLNSGKNKSNKRYFLNNNNRIVPITKPKKFKSLSTSGKKPIRSNTNFYLSNLNFYNTGLIVKNENLDKFQDYNNKKGIFNQFSSRTIPKKNTLYKIKSTGTPLSNRHNIKKIKILNNPNNTINKISTNNYNTFNDFNNNFNNNNLNFSNFKYNFNFGYENSLEKILNENYIMYQDAKHSLNSFDLISAYGVNTYKGIFRNYNEDRVSIIVNAKNPKKK